MQGRGALPTGTARDVSLRVPATPEELFLRWRDDGDTAAMAEDVARVRAAIRGLPEPYRSVAILRWVHGLEPAAIADLREEPPGTVWSLLSRAMAKLRKGLGALSILAVLHPAERGLPPIRETVLDRARALRPLAPGGTGGPSPLPGRGGVAGPGLLAAGLAAAVVLGIVGIWAWGPAGATSPLLGTGAFVPESAAAPSRGAKPPSPPSGDGLPPPVDLHACDPDRDLYGVVVDAAGNTVGGAEVTTWFRPFGDIFYLSLEESRLRTPGPSALTAADGTFSLPLERGASCDLRAEAPGRGLARLGWRMAGERVRLVLAEPPTLAVRARDASGRPVEGVVLSPSRMDESGRNCHLPVGVTGADGLCLLPEMISGVTCLQVEHAAFRAKSPFFVDVPAEGTLEVEIAMTPGIMTEGRVVDAATGEGVEGAVVGLAAGLVNAVRTGAGGRFLFPFFELDSSRVLHARAEGFARGQGMPAEDGEFRIELRRGWSAAGRLLTPEGASVAGALVTCLGHSPPGSGFGGPDSASAPGARPGRGSCAPWRGRRTARRR